MRVLEIGREVFLLRFLPDNRQLLVGSADADRAVTFELVALPGGARVPLAVPGANVDSWWYDAWYGNPVAISPEGDVCYIAWAGRLYAFGTADGRRLPVPPDVLANQVILSPAGDHLIAAYRTRDRRGFAATTTGPNWHVSWVKGMAADFDQVAGFLPDGERFVTVDGTVRIRSFATGDELTAGRAKPFGAKQPQISADGRYLGLLGHGSMYFWDLTMLDKPRQIKASSNFGDFRSFAFHPDGRSVAVIHGGPTLIKVYDLATLKRTKTWTWKLGPLRSVTYSPDGSLGAAGSVDGRIVVWDEDL